MSEINSVMTGNDDRSRSRLALSNHIRTSRFGNRLNKGGMRPDDRQPRARIGACGVFMAKVLLAIRRTYEGRSGVHDDRLAARSRSTRSVTSRATATVPITSLPVSPFTIAKLIST